MMQELLSCPFCGDHHDYNPSISESHGYKEPGNAEAGLVHKGWYVECDKCGGCGPHLDGKGKARQKAIAAWNQRALPDDVKALVEAAQEIYNNHRGAEKLVTFHSGMLLEKLTTALAPFTQSPVGDTDDSNNAEEFGA